MARWRDEALASRSELRPVADPGLHVTLVFLGRRPSEEVQRIWEVAVAALAGREAPRLDLASATWIPPRRPRLLAVELSDDAGRAAGVHEALSGALAKEGLYQPERRPFWPHVTVARARGRAKVRKAELAAPPRARLHGRSGHPLPQRPASLRGAVCGLGAADAPGCCGMSGASWITVAVRR